MTEDVLWRIVAFDKSQSGEAPGDINASFEAALQQVDAHLESLIQVEVVPPPEAPTAPPAPAPAAGAANAQVPAARNPPPPVAEPGSGGALSGAEAEAQRQLLQRALELGARPVQPPVAPPAPAPSAGGPAPLGVDEQQLAQLIEKRYSDVQAKRDHFTMLGLAIGPDLKREQVKTAFLGLAKRFHPDRLPQSLSPLAPKMTAIFEAIREAYEVLYDDAKRAAYLQELRAKGASQQARPRPGGGLDPEELFKMGEVFFRKRDFAAAAEHFERAFQTEPKALYLAARGWAIFMDPQRKAEAGKAKQMMADALKRDPQCERAHYQLGVIARVEGDMERAERHFRETVRVNPKHLEASQELRIIEMRRKNPPPGKKGGLFR
ncbi:hypothetical protein MEBOL_001195 [Melittangium boletus DSM 14713]|uniref:J domain-containing protein n=2 Tax=Melittangium boletus TaxID=83453 RepID=A0A250I966_9BACT|nr:hypothetical protein MEBOL_001195 [Melittangium boletus DSM 14713]